VGTVLYTVCAITRCPIEEFTREFLPFFAALVGVLVLLALVPPLVTFLPDLLF
jgi:TRAP-type C4-dicarboxylate transport system permease large subunit